MSELADRCYHDILDRLVTGTWPPGHRLNRRDVAHELGVSVAPVLEAMVRLEHQGLLETIPRVGTRVRAITAETVYGQMVVRAALEVQAVHLAHGAALRPHRDALAALADEADRPHREPRRRWAADLDFHRALVACAGVPALDAAYAEAMQVGFFHAVNVVVEAPDRRRPADSHTALLRRLLRSDRERAEAAIRRHLASGKLAVFSRETADAA